jgi:hypothetical protein
LGAAPALIIGFADRSDIHAFHGVEWGLLAGVLFAGSMIRLALRPTHSPAAVLTMLTVGVTFAAVSAATGVLDGQTLTPLVMAVVLAVAAGGPWLPTTFRPGALPMAALAVVAAAAGLMHAVTQMGYQTSRADEHAADLHYAGAAIIGIAIPLVAYLLSTRPGGYRVQAALVSVVAIVVGMASLLIDQVGALDTLPALGAIAWGGAFGAAAWIDGLRPTASGGERHV